MNFENTSMGKRFYSKDLPQLVKALNRLSAATEKQNLLTEQQLKLEEKRMLLEKKKAIKIDESKVIPSRSIYKKQ